MTNVAPSVGCILENLIAYLQVKFVLAIYLTANLSCWHWSLEKDFARKFLARDFLKPPSSCPIPYNIAAMSKRLKLVTICLAFPEKIFIKNQKTVAVFTFISPLTVPNEGGKVRSFWPEFTTCLALPVFVFKVAKLRLRIAGNVRARKEFFFSQIVRTSFFGPSEEKRLTKQHTIA